MTPGDLALARRALAPHLGTLAESKLSSLDAPVLIGRRRIDPLAWIRVGSVVDTFGL